MKWLYFILLPVLLMLTIAVPAAGAATGPGAISIVPPGWHPTPRSGPPPTHVEGVVTRDTGIDVSATINYWGRFYGVSPIGITAALATESGINQYADRYGVWPDVSFGIAQFTVETATGFGLCSDTASCRAALDNPYTSIRLAALFFSQLARQTCLSFPTLYVAYNAGGGYGCNAYFYFHPSGTAANAFAVYLGNFAYVANVYGRSDPPPPPVFTLALWNAYRMGHHKTAISPYLKSGTLNWAASVWRYHQAKCRGVIGARYFSHGGYTKTRFALCSIFTWARFHSAKVRYHQPTR